MDRSLRCLDLRLLAILTMALAVALAAALPLSCPAAAQTGEPPATSAAVINSLVDNSPVLEVRKPAARHTARPNRRHLARDRHHGAPLDRPALAGVLLVEPIPAPVEPPRPIVPMPAYFIDGLASGLTTPPPPVVCDTTHRDRSLPDPHLDHEVPLVCHYDIE